MRFEENPLVHEQRAKLLYVVDNLDRQGFTDAEIAHFLGVRIIYVSRCLEKIGATRDRLRDAKLAGRFRKRDPGHRKRAANAGNEYQEVDLWQVWLRDDGICHLCGVYVEPDDLDFDHVWPIARGGAHCAENVKVSHASCNRSKGARV
jgi:hypothetical protein